ncbi:glycosyltransferase involved in cell wall biosynthesis [Mesoflavibacter sabulilitoris]|uniref:Glycosyltransferase n=1 Tax=Mesoflavibacter zeaxanthinifaciens subsp. sabulilitoris TaxID=1520893 RepID=A0A2T1NB47_9FLAO|nr:glycosyltransferase [Mesoflavibacter zeaxanthinifaciens]MBB3123521.1 glycosyltransferase involved in cell wall biosynthesis [Mesoflavibacter zeaxanthinifaciens subsp. sabulilitoris]PSG89348.1 glycosyltransferase [Mesoflavibacter zeaxanthinifaciens subsp. sabulilitoris]
MKVLQLIDSLEAGGAERVAVNIANALSAEISKSYLCSTRQEGILKASLDPKVDYFFLNKKRTFDLKAIIKLKSFIKQEQIDIIHAHSSSYFTATLVKLLYPKIKIIWHDHYGNSEFLHQRPKQVLKLCSYFFNHVFSVNQLLASWAERKLYVKSVNYLPNFSVENKQSLVTQLKGVEGKRIVCLANLRPQKDHINLLHAFKAISHKHQDWTLHLVGKDFEDDYTQSIKQYIKDFMLSGGVFLYGSCPDTSAILKHCDIGVLSSKSEGLPLALIEYGLASLPTIATNVGQCKEVIINEQTGLLVPSENSNALSEALESYINNSSKREVLGHSLYLHIDKDFSKKAVISTIKGIYSNFVPH